MAETPKSDQPSSEQSAWEQYQERQRAAELAGMRHEELVQSGASDEDIRRMQALRQKMNQEVVRYGREQGFIPEPPKHP